MIKEIVHAMLIKLRRWLGDFHVFIWRHKTIRKILHQWVYESKNAELKNIHQGRRAFIIGNGPSILKQDLTKLNGEITFVLNNFFLHPQYHQINPTYLCSADPGMKDRNYRQSWYRLHQKIDTRKTVKLFCKSAEKVDSKYHLFTDHKVYYIRSTSMLMPPLSEMNYCPTDLTMPLSGHNLIFVDIALLAACYMGIKKIYLLGFDGQPINSFKEYLHYNFYGKDPTYTMKQYKKDYRFHVLSRSYKKSRQGLYERSAACIKRTFLRQGINIYNATYNRGSLTGFDYVQFEELVGTKHG
jgi:hypothetical protein